MEGNNTEYQYLCDITRKRIIEFSIKQFYEDNFNILVKNNYVINFEKARISYLMHNSIFEMPKIENSKVSKYILTKEKSAYVVSDSNKSFLVNFSSYLFKLRKGILDPDKLRYKYNDKADLKIHVENESFLHPVLGKCTVIRRNQNETIVKTKIGNIKVMQ